MTQHPIRSLGPLARLVSPRHVAAGVVAVVGLSVTEAAGLLLLLPLLQLVGLDSAAGAPGGAAGAVWSALLALGLPPTLGVLLVLYVGIATVQSVLRRWQPVLTNQIVQDVVVTLRRRLYNAITRLRWETFVRHRSADFAHALTAEIDRAGVAAHHAAEAMISSAVALVYFTVAFRMSPAMTSVITVAGAALAFAMRPRLVASRETGDRVSQAMARLHAAIAEQLGAMKTARSYGAERRHAAIFDRLSGDLSDVTLASTRELGRFQQHLTMGSTVALALVVYVSASVLSVPAAQLLVMLFVFARLMPRLTGLYERGQMLATLLPAFDRVSGLIASCESAAEPALSAAPVAPLRNALSLDRVTFSYRSDDSAIALQEINLTIRAGSTTAIVGPSGAGKTTIADLILGLVTPTSGEIRVDSQPLQPNQLASWRSQVGYVPQDAFLFHDTVRANLLWAQPDADTDALWRALALAAADGFVAALPEGLDTIVGDRGVLVSGGERQRIALARALLRRPRLLVLDEATSALDSENETRIQDAVDGLHGQMTIVVITHRLSAMRHADFVYVVDEGCNVESGTIAQLLARPSSRFQALWRAQGLDEGHAAFQNR
jgi:ATP-binding cassette subfamily C protein